MYYTQYVAQAYLEKGNLSAPSKSPTYDLPITISNALPLSYRGLMGATCRPLNWVLDCGYLIQHIFNQTQQQSVADFLL